MEIPWWCRLREKERAMKYTCKNVFEVLHSSPEVYTMDEDFHVMQEERNWLQESEESNGRRVKKVGGW